MSGKVTQLGLLLHHRYQWNRMFISTRPQRTLHIRRLPPFPQHCRLINHPSVLKQLDHHQCKRGAFDEWRRTPLGSGLEVRTPCHIPWSITRGFCETASPNSHLRRLEPHHPRCHRIPTPVPPPTTWTRELHVYLGLQIPIRTNEWSFSPLAFHPHYRLPRRLPFRPRRILFYLTGQYSHRCNNNSR